MSGLSHPSAKHKLQSRLMILAACFLFLLALNLSFSPAARLHTWAVSYRWQHWLGFAVWAGGYWWVHRTQRRLLPDADPYLLPVTAMLTGWGLLTIWRLDVGYGLRQTLWLGISLCVYATCLHYPQILQILRKYKYVWLTGILLVLGLTFFFGVYPGGNGPRLWLGCCGVYFQPSEFLKIFLVVYLAAYLTDTLSPNLSLLHLLPPSLILILISMGLLFGQRDLGTASLILALYTCIIYVASGKRRVLLIAAGVLVVGIGAGYSLFDVVKVRVDAWLNPWIDPSGRSYQIVQSLIAVAAGRLMGTGPGLGSPGLVPVSHSDFIFSAITEETGLLGAFGLLILLALLVNRGLFIALRARQPYERLLAAGLAASLGLQSLLIIGGNLRMVPLTGVTLPFVSYGGSSLLAGFLALALLCLISSNTEEESAPIATARPYLFAGSVFLGFIMVTGLALIWWGVIRADSLLGRNDNARRSISDRYVQRGSLLDRSNQVIAQTTGQPGSYTREYLIPSLGPVIGYTTPFYGLGGLEADLDAYLRGLKGLPQREIAWHYLLFAQAPPGRNVRLTLDLSLQRQADQAMQATKGALVLLNAHTGEVLAMSSTPGYDPNQLSENWNSLIVSPDAPLLNRAALGAYPAGTSLGPFLLSTALAQGSLPTPPETTDAAIEGVALRCARLPNEPRSWGSLVSSGCPTPLLTLYRQLRRGQWPELLQSLNLLQSPGAGAAANSEEALNSEQSIVGTVTPQVSPLQMAVAAAAISQSGVSPSPLLALSVETLNGWVVLPVESSKQALSKTGAEAAAKLLAVPGSPLWQSSGTGLTNDKKWVSWYFSGTLPEWQGTPLTLVVALEENNPTLAQSIGQTVIQAALNYR